MELNSPLSIIGIILAITLVLFGLNTLLGHPGSSPPLGPAASMVETDNSSPYPWAPELVGIKGYINAQEGFTLASLKGKVVIVDFWTYSCINCIRTQPYLNAWYEKYHSQGLEIIGVHTPEFDFEKKYENVQAAVVKEGIQYPVVLDNDYQTWRAYQNRYWPRKYLIDAQGRIRYDHIGEGAYEETESQIITLLKERDENLKLEGMISDDVKEGIDSTEFYQIKTPEIYLGYAFARAPLTNEEGFQPDESVEYTLPPALIPNQVGLEGTWGNHSEYMELESDEGKVVLPYTAKQVNMVASGPATLNVILDGEVLNTMNIEEETLYTLVGGKEYGSHTLELDVQGKGFKLYTFTFG
jgi:thiol-disulfide isomerase/thioredoxin